MDQVSSDDEDVAARLFLQWSCQHFVKPQFKEQSALTYHSKRGHRNLRLGVGRQTHWLCRKYLRTTSSRKRLNEPSSGQERSETCDIGQTFESNRRDDGRQGWPSGCQLSQRTSERVKHCLNLILLTLRSFFQPVTMQSYLHRVLILSAPRCAWLILLSVSLRHDHLWSQIDQFVLRLLDFLRLYNQKVCHFGWCSSLH